MKSNPTNQTRKWFVISMWTLAILMLFGMGLMLREASAFTYERRSGVSGTLNSIGSDTLNNLMTLWAESFRAQYPSVNVQIEGKGSSTAPPALIESTAQLGPMSRPMKSKELDAFEAAFGYKPYPVAVAIDALAIYVHKDSPTEDLTLMELDAIFSSTYKRGGAVPQYRDWSLYGRNSASGTYGMFKKLVMKGGDFRVNVKEQPGSSAVVQGVANELNAIGYSGIGYRTSGVKTISIGGYLPTLENCLNGNYPLARFLYVYVNKKPNQPLDTLTYEFLKFVLSDEGQRIVEKDGYYPLPPQVVDAHLKKLR